MKVHYLPPKHASWCFSNEFLQHRWQESFDSDSVVSQSRFDDTDKLNVSGVWHLPAPPMATFLTVGKPEFRL